MQRNIVSNLLVLVTFGVALAALEDHFLLSCNSDDLPCLNNSTHLFLNKTKHGNKILKLQPIDPLFLKSSEYSELFPVQLSYHFSNVTVMGLKDMDLIDFKIDMDAKTVAWSTRAYVSLSGDVGIVTPLTIPVIEPFTFSADTLVTVKYNYKLKRFIFFEHFILGPEQLDCNVLPPLKQNSRTGLLKASKDTHANKGGLDIPAEALCAVVKDAHKVVIQNLRDVAKILPARAFIENIH